MAPQHALSDEQVNSEMKKMVSFIKQESLEKAREIRIKADEEFAIEKARIVREEQAKVDAEYGHKQKQAAMKLQIEQSNIINDTRLQILAARNKAFHDVMDTASSKIHTVAQDKSKYANLLEKMILEGFYAIVDTEFTVRARKEDFKLVEKALTKALATFRDVTAVDAQASIEKNNPLPAKSYVPSSLPQSVLIQTRAGGVIVSGLRGKIIVNNTLDERLSILQQDALPSIRQAIFGT